MKFDTAPQPEGILDKKEQGEKIKSLYRGIWAENLVNNEELPVGGSMFSNELTTKLKLDFDAFDEETKGFAKENFRLFFEKDKVEIEEWIEKAGLKVDPFLFFSCNQVQRRVSLLLEAPKEEGLHENRDQIYSRENVAKLSDLKGKSSCAERAALGQYLFQKIGIDSAYMSGIIMEDAHSQDEYPDNHSFLIVMNPNNKEETFVFDIARPKSQHNLPRILKTDVLIIPELFEGERDLLVRTEDIYQSNYYLYFGIGDNVAGKHKVVENVDPIEILTE